MNQRRERPHLKVIKTLKEGVFSLSAFLAVLEKLFAAPSAVVAAVVALLRQTLWLVFCLLVLRLSGPHGLTWIIPYVLTNLADKPTPPLLPKLDASAAAKAPWVLNIFPCVTWALVAAVLLKRVVLP